MVWHFPLYVHWLFGSIAEDIFVIRCGSIVKSFFPFSSDCTNKMCWSELQFFGLVLISITEVMLLHKAMPFAIRQPYILIPKGIGCATEGSSLWMVRVA
jgi:hypothetical protein